MPESANRFFSKPSKLPDTQPREGGGFVGTQLRRLLRVLGFWNACLLPPMVTLIVVDLVASRNTHLLLHNELVMAGFCLFFGAE